MADEQRDAPERPDAGDTPEVSPNDSGTEGASTHTRKRVVAGIGIAIVVLLAAGAYFAYRAFQSPKTGEQGTFFGALPEAGQREDRTQTPTPTTTEDPQPSPTPTPTFTPSPLALESEHVAVTVSYTSTPEFTLEIEDIAYTSDQVTADFYEPREGAPYSRIRIFGEENETLVDQQFVISRAFVGEGPDFERQTATADEGTAYLVFDIGDAQAGRIELQDQQGAILDEAQAPERASRGLLERAVAGIGSIFSSGPVRAQSSAGITLVVINDGPNAAPAVAPVAAALRNMKNTIEPWSSFSGRVNVVEVSTVRFLGCTQRRPDGSFGFPRCPNDAAVIQEVNAALRRRFGGAGLRWQGIVVATESPCNCGSVAQLTGTPIVAVGANADRRLLVHEHGHSIGDMDDEYLYQNAAPNAPAPRNAPNCFSSRASCTNAVEQYPEAQCFAGCNGGRNTTFRPATQIMHNTYDTITFGPLEECLMRNQLRRLLGEPTTNCTEDDDGDSDEGQRGERGRGTFWGWGI